ncbi:unnamed protein product [Closterium sp. Yama58-4]|nr:unnamed protein product [Closterium sp. Yama58-4]
MDPFARLPDDLLLAILSRVGSAARDVTRAAMTCRRWNEVTRSVPALCLGPSGGGASANQAPFLTFERQASRMILRTRALRHLTIISPPAPPANNGGPSHPSLTPSRTCHGSPIPSGPSAPPSAGPSAFCRRPSYSTESAELPGASASCACCSQHDSASGASVPLPPLPPPRHPREFIFEAWMRHVGPSLHSLTLSRALPAVTSLKRPRDGCASGACGGNSVVVNLWEEEDASLHLAHISRHCTNLSSLSLGHVSLSAPTLLATLQPMPALQHLSLSWLHASPAALHAVLDVVPNLRHLTIFIASGFPCLELRLPPSLQHLTLSYIRADSVALLSARSLQSLSLRDMFLRALSIRDAPNLRQLSVASANCLLVSAPHSDQLASIDLRAGSLNWPATETLISTSAAALESLSLDFFTSSSSGLSSVSSLPWLAQNCIVNLFSAMSGERSADAGEAVLLLALPHVRLFNDLIALQRVSRSLYRTIRDSPCFWLRFHHLHVEPFPIIHHHVSAALSETAAPRTRSEIRPIRTRGADSEPLAALPRYKLVEAALKVYARRSQGQLREVILDGEDVRGDVIITVLAGCKQLEKLSVRMCAHVSSSHIVTLLQSQWGALAASTAPANSSEISPLPSRAAAQLVPRPPPAAPSASSPLLADSLPESPPPIPPTSLESTQPDTLESPYRGTFEPPQVSTAAAPAPSPRLWQVRMAGTDCPSTDFLFIRDMLKRAAASLPAHRRPVSEPSSAAAVSFGSSTRISTGSTALISIGSVLPISTCLQILTDPVLFKAGTAIRSGDSGSSGNFGCDYNEGLSFAPLEGAFVRSSASEGLVQEGEARSSGAFPGRRLQIVSTCPSVLDIDFCPRCANVRAVLDCPTSVQWRQHLERVAEDSSSIKVQATVRSLLKQQACRGCLRCIPRCIFCGSCTKHTCMPLGQIQSALHQAAQQGSRRGSDSDGQDLESSGSMGGRLEDPALRDLPLTPVVGPVFSEDGAVNVGEREVVDLASMGWVMCGCTLCCKEQCTSRMLTCVGCNWRCCPWHIEKYAEIAVSNASFVCEICSHQDRDPVYDL